MLYLTRRKGEKIIINNEIELEVIETKPKAVKLGFVFPSDCSVLRKEIYDVIKAENLSASEKQESSDANVDIDFKKINVPSQLKTKEDQS